MALASSSIAQRLFGRERHNQQFRSDFIRELRSAIAARDWERLRWTLRYHLRTRDDASYLALFEGGHGRVCGEVTPSYSILDASDVRRVHALLPDLRVIYMTGYTRNAIVHNGVLDPGTRLITKPFTVTQLESEMRAALADLL